MTAFAPDGAIDTVIGEKENAAVDATAKMKKIAAGTRERLLVGILSMRFPSLNLSILIRIPFCCICQEKQSC
jgi:hypothetical protein